jgi:4-methyl-5(b-hydroxyethyl)-thiazole monophosphate biosynthesis
MKKILYLFLATGFEEIEAVATLDVLRRAGLEVLSVSISEALEVVGAHGITIKADVRFTDIEVNQADMLILPGGMPGTKNLNAFPPLKEALKAHAAQGKALAAICAAPMILGQLGLLEGKEATCYPGNEADLKGATLSDYLIVQDGNVITASGPGVALEFGLQIVQFLEGDALSENIAQSMLLS